MALQIMADVSQFVEDRSKGVVVLESTHGPGSFPQAFDELGELRARTEAQRYAAQQGMASPRINGNVVGPYPVNSQGLSLEQVRGGQGEVLPQTHPLMQPRHYRVDVPLAAPLL